MAFSPKHYTPKPKAKSKEVVLYGLHTVMEALHAGTHIEKIWIQKERKDERVGELRQLAEEHNVPIQWVPSEKIQQLVPNEEANHQGIVAHIAQIAYQPLEELVLRVNDAGDYAFLLLLDGVTDVRNFGAIARSAECMGVHAVIVPMQGAAAINADAMKVSAGALNHIPVCRETNLIDTANMLKSYGVKLVACTEKSKDLVAQTDFTGPVCIVMGSEETGISPALLKLCDARVKIPMVGQVGSLNVSVSAGVILYEVVRQRGFE